MIKLVDVGKINRSIGRELEDDIVQVLRSGWYVNGENVKGFEKEWAEYCGVNEAVGVASGLDALRVALDATLGEWDDGERRVVVPANTYTATPMAVASVGAIPIFCDVDPDTWLMTPDTLDPAFERVTSMSEEVDAVIPVHLFGQAVDMPDVLEYLSQYDNEIYTIEDAAQAQGAYSHSFMAGTWGDVGCFSFFPGKNIGAVGDAGACVANDDVLAEKMRAIRNQGQYRRYEHDLLGYTARLDEIQAAVLRVKIRHLDEWNRTRCEIAAWYLDELTGVGDLSFQTVRSGMVWHQFVIRTKDRDALRNHLTHAGVETIIHYPTPCHLQKAFSWLGHKEGDFPVAEALARETLSIPIHPVLERNEAEAVVDAIKSFF